MSKDITGTPGQTQAAAGVVSTALLGTFSGPFDQWNRERFAAIDRDVMREIGELKKALAEFDVYRHEWAEISANNTAPGRDSEYKKRLEVMQGYALQSLDAAAWRLRARIRKETPSA